MRTNLENVRRSQLSDLQMSLIGEHIHMRVLVDALIHLTGADSNDLPVVGLQLHASTRHRALIDLQGTVHDNSGFAVQLHCIERL